MPNNHPNRRRGPYRVLVPIYHAGAPISADTVTKACASTLNLLGAVFVIGAAGHAMAVLPVPFGTLHQARQHAAHVGVPTAIIDQRGHVVDPWPEVNSDGDLRHAPVDPPARKEKA